MVRGRKCGIFGCSRAAKPCWWIVYQDSTGLAERLCFCTKGHMQAAMVEFARVDVS